MTDWLYDSWRRAYYKPDWLTRSLTLYTSIALGALIKGRSILKKCRDKELVELGITRDLQVDKKA